MRTLHPISVQRFSSSPTTQKIEVKNRNLIDKLKLSVTLRDNILYIFSYLLHGCEGGLTEEQYTSLNILYDFLSKKKICMYSILPGLPQLTKLDLNQQTKLILLRLVKILPPYLQCTAKFLINEIQAGNINFNVLLAPTKTETFNYLANIDMNLIFKGKIKLPSTEELLLYDKYSNITLKALGPAFVKLLSPIPGSNISIPQELFGLMLINLPNPSNDPVLEENIRYLYDVTVNNHIMNWDVIGNDLVGKDAYTLIFSILSKILINSNTGMPVKNAAIYVYNHLKILESTYSNPNFKYIHDVVKQDIDIGLLLSAIIPQEFGPDAVHMKDRLLSYFTYSYKSTDLDQAFRGFNKYGYQNPEDLLMAFLTRINTRVATTNVDIIQPAAALLPAMIMRKFVREFTPFVSPEIDILILLESLKNPDIDPVLSSNIDSIKLEIISQPRLSVLLSTIIPVEKNKCAIPRQCLINTFEQVSQIQSNIPMTLTTKLQNVKYILKSTTTTNISPHYEVQSIPQTYPITDVDVYTIEQTNPLVVQIEQNNNGQPTKIQRPKEIKKSAFSWNVGKYIDSAGPAVETSQSKPTTDIDFSTIKWITSTTTDDQETTTENLSHEGLVKQVTVSVPKIPQLPAKITKQKISSPNIKQIEQVVTEPSSEKPSEERSSETEETVSQETQSQPDTKESKESKESEITKESVVSKESTIDEYQKPITYKKKLITSQETTETTQITETRSEKTTSTETKDEEATPAVVLFPPAVEPDQPLTIHMTHTGVPIVTATDKTATDSETDETEKVVLPGIKELLHSPNLDIILKNNTSIVTQILQPLSVIFGKNYVKKILKEVDVSKFHTNIALLTELLIKAKSNPKVKKNTELTTTIEKYISTLEYVSPTVLLPIAISSKKFTSNVVYSTFKASDLTYSGISETLPSKITPDTITIPLVNPKIWLQSVNPSNPYGDLLPTLEVGNPLRQVLQPLKLILTREKITEILGSDFDPLIYPNKGALLIILLQKLQTTKIIQKNRQLKLLIDNYIRAIELPSINIQVSEDVFVKMMSETTGHWQPELTSLIQALPVATNNIEVSMIEEIEQFLADPSVLEKLQITNTPSQMTRGELLNKIITDALSGIIRLEKRTQKALRYYKDKIDFSGAGALPIMWVWVEVYVVKAEVKLGDMIQNTLNFNSLPRNEKIAYNDLVTYLAQNPDILQDTEGFDFEQYKTQGQFVKALFKYLLKKPQINSAIKKNIQILLPRVQLTGPGAIPIPSLSQS